MEKTYIDFPWWISPDVFHPSLLAHLPSFMTWLSFFKWYGLMYIFATVISYKLFMRQVRENHMEIPPALIEGFFTWGIIGLLLGARIFATLIYDTSGLYWSKPWLIFLPFDESGNFSGFRGMSFHGGALGLVIALFWFYQRKKTSSTIDLLTWGDFLAAAIPLGYTFGRLGNFINAELYGTVTAGGILFPGAVPFSTDLAWVRSFAESIGMQILPHQSWINLPRHPSQLYEALGEGILLWLLQWHVFRPRKPFKGFLISTFMIGYGSIRFFIEYFRDSSHELGYLIEFQEPHALGINWLNFTAGQVFCLVMILAGIVSWLFFAQLKKITDVGDAQ